MTTQKDNVASLTIYSKPPQLNNTNINNISINNTVDTLNQSTEQNFNLKTQIEIYQDKPKNVNNKPNAPAMVAATPQVYQIQPGQKVQYVMPVSQPTAKGGPIIYQYVNPPGQPTPNGAPVVYQNANTPGQPITTGVPVFYQYVNSQGQPVIIQQQQNTPPQTIIIKEKKRHKKIDNCCYCRGPKQSPCGCLDEDKEYCCAIVGFSYILMSLSYILMGLMIISCCCTGHFWGRDW